MSTTKRILIVEDDRVLRRACEVGLKKRGYEVVTADNGADGLARALDGGFDLILLDMLMPRMSGMEMLRELRLHEQDGPRAPVLVLSNSSRVGSREEAEQLGVAGYMVKACLSLESLGTIVAQLTASESAPEGRAS
jgi:CheY-like chemotaxis protein